MSKTVMMKCGHAANAVDGAGKPACAICCGILDGATEIADMPDLAGRKARCFYYGKQLRKFGYHASECSECNSREDSICTCERDSDTDLPFFEHLSGKEFDGFYCGCHSWN